MQACISDNLICQYSIVTHMMERSDYDKIGHIYHFIYPVLDMDIIIIQQYIRLIIFTDTHRLKRPGKKKLVLLVSMWIWSWGLCQLLKAKPILRAKFTDNNIINQYI